MASRGVAKKSGDIAKIHRAAFLARIRAGDSIKDACSAAGWAHTNSYYYNRKEWPLWAEAVDQAKIARRANAATPDASPYTQFPRKADGHSFAGNIGTPEDLALDDFRYFVGKFFPDRQPHKPQQLEIVKQLKSLRPREVCLLLLWPEAGKTSTIEDYICKTLAEDPNHRFRIISEGQDLSKRIVGTCARRFTDNNDYTEFIATYGPFYEKGQERKGKPWTTDQLTLLTNNGHERDRSLVAQSWSGANYGSRIDTLIIDDVQSQRNFGQADEIFRRIRGTFFNRGKEMRTLIVGTRIGADDFYDRMMKAGLITRKKILAAMTREGEPTVPEAWDTTMIHDGGPCCSGFRTCPRNGVKLTPKEFMEQMRHQTGEDSWWAAYQQNPTADARTSFGALIDRCLDKDRAYGRLLAGVR